jgi:hypothetical protein
MAEDRPFCHSAHQPKPRTSTPGEVVWMLRRDQKCFAASSATIREMVPAETCNCSAPVDCSAASRRQSESSARVTAEHLRQGHLRDGWIEISARGACA